MTFLQTETDNQNGAYCSVVLPDFTYTYKQLTSVYFRHIYCILHTYYYLQLFIADVKSRTSCRSLFHV